MNWYVVAPLVTLAAMSEQMESALQVGAFKPFMSTRPVEPIGPSAATSLAKPTTRHSVVATAFLMLYVALYLAVGFLGISLVGRAWATVFE